MEMKEAMKIALDNEHKGQDLYREAASNTQNEFVKKTFEYLADQEQRHIDEIKQYLEDGDFNKINLGGDSPQDSKAFFNSSVKEFKDNLKTTENDLHAYEKGLELENEAYKFYEERAKEAKDEKVRKFFEWLKEQEMTHYDFFQKGYEFLKDPGHFNAEEEGWFFEG